MKSGGNYYEILQKERTANSLGSQHLSASFGVHKKKEDNGPPRRGGGGGEFRAANG